MPNAKKAHLQREAMLDKVEALFAENGFGASSLRDVMGACGVSTTAFYARFESKEAVLDELIVSLVADIQGEVVEALDTVRSIEEGFATGAAAFVRAIRGRKGLVRVLLAEASASAGVRDTMRTAFGTLVALLEDRLTRVGDTEPAARAWAVIGAVHMQVFRWAVLEDLDDAEFESALLRSARTIMPR